MWQHHAQSLRFECATKPGITDAGHLVKRDFCIRNFAFSDRCGGNAMDETVIKLRLNQQQLELIDRTIAQGVALDRAALVRLALREYVASRKAETAGSSR
jgi:hypothetical protein